MINKGDKVKINFEKVTFEEDNENDGIQLDIDKVRESLSGIYEVEAVVEGERYPIFLKNTRIRFKEEGLILI